MTASSDDVDVEALLRLARDKSIEGRKQLVAVVSDLFFGKNTVLMERERALMTDILKKLIHDVAVPVRRALAERLAAESTAPHDVIVALASDEIEVAAPILLKSEALLDIELIEIVRHRSLQHQLTIAMRRSLSETVSDALVETGNSDVIKTLLENPDGRISEATMAYLVDQSKTIDSFQEPILRRHDLSPALAKKMYVWVSAALRHHIVEQFAVDVTALDDTIEAISRAHAAKADANAKQRGHDKPRELARRLAEANQITSQLVIQSLRQGEIPLFEALLGEMSGLRPTLVRRLMFEPGGEGLAIVARAIDLEKSAFASIFLLTRKARSTERVTDPRELSRVLSLFDRLNPAAAKAVLARWRRDPDFLYALKSVEEGQHGAPSV
ncbi:MAG: DUF2336 domain-containing protein [Dongiaceae bacterium]